MSGFESTHPLLLSTRREGRCPQEGKGDGWDSEETGRKKRPPARLKGQPSDVGRADYNTEGRKDNSTFSSMFEGPTSDACGGWGTARHEQYLEIQNGENMKKGETCTRAGRLAPGPYGAVTELPSRERKTRNKIRPLPPPHPPHQAFKGGTTRAHACA